MKKKFRMLTIAIALCMTSTFAGCNAAKDKIDELRADDSLSSSVVEVDTNESDSLDELETIRLEVQSLQTKLNSTMQSFSVLNHDVDELTERHTKDVTSVNKVHSSDILAVNARIDEQNDTIQALGTEIIELQNSIDTLSQKQSDDRSILTSNISDVRNNVNALRSDYSAFVTEVNTFKSETKETLSSLLSRVEQLEILQSEVTALKARLDTAESDFEQLNDDLDALTETHDNELTALETLHGSDIATINAKISAQETEISQIKETVDGFDSRCLELFDYWTGEQILPLLQELNNDIAEVKIDLAHLSTAFDTFKSETETTLSDHAKRIEQLETINARAGYGWDYVTGYSNVDFSVTNEGITYSGYTSAVKYVSETDSDAYMLIADIYVTNAETVTPDTVKLSLATVGYEWRSGYLPLIFTLPSDLYVFGNSCQYVEIENYSWILDTTTNIGKFNGNGMFTHSLATTSDDGVNYYHYVQGVAVELDTYNTGDLTIQGKHLVVRMYSGVF